MVGGAVLNQEYADMIGADFYGKDAMQSKEQSEMIRSLDKLVKCVGVAIIPIGIVLFSQAFFIRCV